MRIVFILLTFLAGVHNFSVAQTLSCGTLATEQQKDFEQSQTPVYTEVSNVNKKLALTVHVVLNKSGDRGIAQAAIENAVTKLNQVLEEIGLEFYIREVREIENYNLNTVRYGKSSETDLIVQNFVQNTINVYFASDVFDNANTKVCSYTYMPSANKDVMVFEKNCFHESALIEQMGHLFGLYHTHESIFGTSRADGSNCSTTGDLCCDTPAEANLTTFVGSNCSYLGNQTDSTGEYFEPSVHNYMSATMRDCKCRLTKEQYIKVLNTLVLAKGYLK